MKLFFLTKVIGRVIVNFHSKFDFLGVFCEFCLNK